MAFIWVDWWKRLTWVYTEMTTFWCGGPALKDKTDITSLNCIFCSQKVYQFWLVSQLFFWKLLISIHQGFFNMQRWKKAHSCIVTMQKKFEFCRKNLRHKIPLKRQIKNEMKKRVKGKKKTKNGGKYPSSHWSLQKIFFKIW